MSTGTRRPQDQPAHRAVGTRIQRGVRSTLSALSFWSAVLLPLLYVPLLLHGPETAAGRLWFLGLFGLHLASLVGGRNYRREPRNTGERTRPAAAE